MAENNVHTYDILYICKEIEQTPLVNTTQSTRSVYGMDRVIQTEFRFIYLFIRMKGDLRKKKRKLKNLIKLFGSKSCFNFIVE